MTQDSDGFLDEANASVVAARLAAIVESSDDIIVGKTLDGIITSWNPTAERILGYAASEAIGQHIRLIIPPDRWSEEDDVLARIRRGKKVEHFETVRRAKDGRLLNISLTVSPIRDAHGRIVGASKVARDVTGRIRAEQEHDRLLTSEKQARSQADEARMEAEEASRLKDEFLAVVSHELRSPLSAITGWASLMHSGKLDPEETARAAETILRNAQIQTQLISDLLDVSAIVSGRLRLDIVPSSLGSVVKAALEVVRPAAQAKSIHLEVSIEPTAHAVAADPGRLQQVCWNLLSNAIKFTHSGGTVQVRLRRTGSSAELVVSDNGKGISSNLLPVIFERFRQGDGSTTREHGGLGLGLAIVKHLVELHGGEVKVWSDGPGKGAEFVVHLPMLIGRHPAELSKHIEIHPNAGEGSVPTTSLMGLRILAVDDEIDATAVTAAILVSAGAEVKTAASVSQAMDLMKQWRPDVLISDIGMPDEDGYDLIRKVRAQPLDNQRNIPAIALTAFARTRDRLKVLAAGYQMHVPKPIEPLELVTVVASVTKKL
jgi:PAS domain S-box-containing protein